MLIFCNYLEAHIMMCDIKLIRVFLSCYKRILLSHQIIPFSSTLFIHTSLPLSLSYFSLSLSPHPSTFPKKQKRRPEKPFLLEKERAHKEVYKNRIKVGVEEKKKTQGMRRDSAHFYGPSPLFSLFFFTSILGGVFF